MIKVNKVETNKDIYKNCQFFIEKVNNSYEVYVKDNESDTLFFIDTIERDDTQTIIEQYHKNTCGFNRTRAGHIITIKKSLNSEYYRLIYNVYTEEDLKEEHIPYFVYTNPTPALEMSEDGFYSDSNMNLHRIKSFIN